MTALVTVSVLVFLTFTFYQVDGGASQCYQCTGVCDRPTIQQCPIVIGDFSCYSAKIRQPPAGNIEYSKGCAVSNAVSVCGIINSTVLESCYYCTYSLCNDHD